MAEEIIMPALGMTQETGVLLQWLKAAGEEVTAGEPLMEIETDKAIVEVEAPASGILTNLTAGPGDEIPVGQVIAFILSPDEAADPDAQEPPRPPTGEEDRASGDSATQTSSPPPSDEQQEEPATPTPSRPSDPITGRPLASPKARRLAGERDLNLGSILGSGPDGAILAADVLAAAERQPAAPSADLQSLSVSRTWQVMVRRLSQNWSAVPHFYLTAESDASQLTNWREQTQQLTPEKITFTDLFLQITAVALRQHALLNARWETDTILLNHQVDIGIAVAVDDGLVVPVVRRADQLNLRDLAECRRELVARARQGKLSPEDIRDGTFTISNLGMYRVDAFSAVINPPQAAILTFGRIADRVVPVDGQPAVRPMLTLTLSCDHRVVDGASGALFLQTLVDLIENPLQLLLTRP